MEFILGVIVGELVLSLYLILVRSGKDDTMR